MTYKQIRDRRTQRVEYLNIIKGHYAAAELADKECATLLSKWTMASPDSEVERLIRVERKAALLRMKAQQLEAADEDRELELRSDVNTFVSKTLAPMIREKSKACEGYLREKLSEVINADNEHAMTTAIQNMKPTQQLLGWSSDAVIDNGFRHGKAVDQAAAMLDLYAKVEAYDFRKVK